MLLSFTTGKKNKSNMKTSIFLYKTIFIFPKLNPKKKKYIFQKNIFYVKYMLLLISVGAFFISLNDFILVL